MDSDENQGFQSPPSRRHTGMSKLPRLNELKDSDQNARNPTAMPAHLAATGKRPLPTPHETQPQVKRMTQKERAGMPPRYNQFAPPTRENFDPYIRGTTIAGAHNASMNSSSYSRPAPSFSRTMSGTSTSSYTSGLRPPSSQGYGRSLASAGSIRGGINGSIQTRNAFASHGQAGKGPAKHDGMTKASLPSNHTNSLRVKPVRRKALTESTTPANRSCSAPTAAVFSRDRSEREVSISTAMSRLKLHDKKESRTRINPPQQVQNIKMPATPSHIPKPVETPVKRQLPFQSSTMKSARSILSTAHTKPLQSTFMTKDSNTLTAGWDTSAKFDNIEKLISGFRDTFESTTSAMTSQETLKKEISEMHNQNSEYRAIIQDKQAELEEERSQRNAYRIQLEDENRSHMLFVDDLQRKHRIEVEDLRDSNRRGLNELRDQTSREEDTARRKANEETDQLRRRHAEELADLDRRSKIEIEAERTRRVQEVQDINNQLLAQRQNAELDAGTRDKEAQSRQREFDLLNASIESERAVTNSLKDRIKELTTHNAELQHSLEAKNGEVTFLKSDSAAQIQAFADLNKRMEDAIEGERQAKDKLREEESLRRKLHNQVQELKGNIRVFCRVRPPLDAPEDDQARIAYPDEAEEKKDMEVVGPQRESATGKVSADKHPFSFDRVFGPAAGNGEIFEEISQLVQSALDGFNVCIFCYGQTGSGKTHTMSSVDGMIPLAVNQIYDTAKGLEEKGWNYSMNGSFVEVYNENLNDLLGNPSDLDKKKHQIQHDKLTGKTTITDVNAVDLDSPDTVNNLLNKASSNRSVAATNANARSSRSHSVFMLSLVGSNSITGEKSSATLNLVDLAGSERLNQSGATGERLKETQNINSSLSSLGDVIAALGSGKEAKHIPYRNSTLTYLLQNSLGGNSETLMFVMVSPLKAHLSETISSLKFATKVHNTHIGTARKQK